MKTRNKDENGERAEPGRLAAFSMLAGLLSAAAPAFADAPDSGAFKADISRSAVTTLPAYTVDEAASTKTHTLFMGADIAINLDKGLYEVKDVEGSNWVIDINGLRRKVSSREAPVAVKITPGLKLTEVSATIVGYKRVQAYSYANDPSVKLTTGLNHSAEMGNDLLAIAQNAQHIADTISNKDMGPAGVFAQGDNQFGEQALMQTAQTSPATTHPAKAIPGLGPQNSPSTLSTIPANMTPAQFFSNRAVQADVNQTANGNEPQGKIATSGLDAMDVEFDIRAGKMLQDPYVVTVAKFRTPGSKEGMVRSLIFAKSLHPIDEHLSHIHFEEDGFPFNYELLDFQLHLYNRGEEIATNISSDRVELTREEAFQYVRMEYIGAHRGETLPPSPAMGRLPSDLNARLAEGKYGNTFYVMVSKDGLAGEAFSDPACTKRINDEYLDSVVKRIRFKPALNDGKPVDGVTTINLSHLAI
jgi:hypothetical protein